MGFLSEAKGWGRRVAQKIQEVAKAGLKKATGKRRRVPAEAPPEVPAEAPAEVPIEVAEVAVEVPAEAVEVDAEVSHEALPAAPEGATETEPAEGAPTKKAPGQGSP